jgi:hypothetical protein
LRLRRTALSTVRYQRIAFEGTGWRITLDRAVWCRTSAGSFSLVANLEGMPLETVVVEVKGKPPKPILKALGLPNREFSKSRWATGEIRYASRDSLERRPE